SGGSIDVVNGSDFVAAFFQAACHVGAHSSDTDESNFLRHKVIWFEVYFARYYDGFGAAATSNTSNPLQLSVPRESAGLLMYRLTRGEMEFLLVHPGGPLWRRKDAGAWTIPKGEILADEEALSAAQREFQEEVGFRPEGKFVPLTPVRQKAGKLI